MLTRYAGVAVVATGALIILSLDRRPLRFRLHDAAIFVAISLALPVAWSIRNRLVLGSATNRVIAWHPVTFAHLVDLAHVCWKWVGSDEPIRPVLTFAAALLTLAVLIAAFRAARKSIDKSANVAAAMLLYIAAFGITLALSISLVDFYTPVDDRVLSPIYVAGVVLRRNLVARIAAGSPASALKRNSSPSSAILCARD